MKIPGYVIVYPYATPYNGHGYWFMQEPPAAKVDDAARIYRFEVDVPDPITAVAAAVVVEEVLP